MACRGGEHDIMKACKCQLFCFLRERMHNRGLRQRIERGSSGESVPLQEGRMCECVCMPRPVPRASHTHVPSKTTAEIPPRGPGRWECPMRLLTALCFPFHKRRETTTTTTKKKSLKSTDKGVQGDRKRGGQRGQGPWRDSEVERMEGRHKKKKW